MARGWVPRGYDYLGPGNDLHRGPPRNENDVLAEDHDRAYQAILEAGGRPYTQWSEADRIFFDNLRVNDLPTAAAKGIFGLKRTAHALGILRSVENSPSSSNMAGGLRGRSRFDDETRAESTRNSRRPRENDDDNRGDTRRFRTEGTDLEGALIAVGNDPGNDSLLDLPAHPDEGDAERVGLGNMDGAGGSAAGETQLALSANRSSSGMGQVAKETPVTIPPSITYGLQETHTTILPWNGWITAALLDYGTAVQLPIRMNAPVDMLPITTGTDPAAGAVYTLKGLYGSKAAQNGVRSYIPYPATFAGASTDPTERPSWREYWFQIYEYYTVLKCHWEVIVENPMNLSQQQNNPILIGTQFDSYSDTAGSSGNVMPPTTLVESMSFQHMKWYNVDGMTTFEQQATDNNRVVMKGTWMPGMTKRNIINDGDVKTWTATAGGAPPNLKEILTINFWRHPLATQVSAGTPYTNANVQINLKYVVQFKDLKLQARYPNTVSAAGFNITQLLNNNGATGNAYQAPLV